LKPRIKLTITLIIMMLITLACATLTGGNTPDQPAPPAVLPTNTPLPPPPTSTPLPPAPEPTEEPAPPQPIVGEVLFFDDFSDPASGWDHFSGDDGFTDYQEGAYKIGVYTDTYFFWANPYQNFGDQIIDVNTTVISPETDNQYGIICRHQDVDNWYTLVISADGFAAIRKRYQGSDLEYLADWVQVDAINQGQATNDLRAECIGTRLSLFVNNVLVVEVIDAAIPTGDAGLIAGTFDSTMVEVLFDNFKVSAP